MPVDQPPPAPPEPGHAEPHGADPAATLRPRDSGVRPGVSFLAVRPGYEIGELIGRGGEGEVRSAVQWAFGRTVAVKTVRGEVDLDRIKRFRAEAIVTALLEHPNIIPVYDLRGVDGRIQLVMKKIAGVSWKDLLKPRTDEQRLRAAAMTLDDHLDILLDVCNAIRFAHDRGFLHRDLKPENIMVGDHGEVLVMDWGCAAHRWAPTPHELIKPIAELDLISGSPAYMSPEQAAADNLRQGPPSDVYLLGATLYEILTGTPPHRGRTVDATLRTACRGEIEDPRERAGKGREVPDELATVALAALHQDPARRTQTVAAFSQAVRDCLIHREALHLLADARAEAARADDGGADADDSFRRAISACEQALRLWPGYGPAKRLYVDVSLGSADMALTAKSWRVCQRHAGSAAVVARDLDLADEYREAEQLAEAAERGEREAAAHERHVRLLQRLILVIGVAVVCGLAAGIAIVLREHRGTAEALVISKASLARADRERDQRLEGENHAAPALVAKARELASLRDFIGALFELDLAIRFNPALLDAGVLRGQCLAAQRSFSLAADEFARCAALPESEAVPSLDAVIERCRFAAAQPGDVAVLREIGDLFLKQGAAAAAEALFSSGDGLDDLYRRRVAAALPGLPSNGLQRFSDGAWGFRVGAKPELSSLEFLRDIPLTTFTAQEQPRLRDLGVLQGMPLTSVDLLGSGVRDLGPIAGSSLRRLVITRTGVTDLAPLRALALDSVECSGTAVADLSPLAGMPLRRLIANDCVMIADLSPLAGMPLEELSLAVVDERGGALADLRSLAGRPVRQLDLTGQRKVVDLAPLKALPLERLILDDTGVKSLAPLAGMRIKRLSLMRTAVSDLGPVAGMPLEQLDFDRLRVTTGMEVLNAIPSLTRINGVAAADFRATAAIHRELAKRNPGYHWGAVLVSDGAKLLEIEGARLGLRDLSPLAGQPLRRIWLPDNPVPDLRLISIAALETVNVSGSALRTIEWASGATELSKLLLSRTEVVDLEPLDRKSKAEKLKVLHIDGTPIVDLRPLTALRLEEFVFTPRSNLAGIELIRSMASLRRIGVTADRLLPRDEFWKAWDAGTFRN